MLLRPTAGGLAAERGGAMREAGFGGCVFDGVFGWGRGNLRMSFPPSYDVEILLDTMLTESAIFLSRKRLPKRGDGMRSKSHTS
jgi:hypothetical protein